MTKVCELSLPFCSINLLDQELTRLMFLLGVFWCHCFGETLPSRVISYSIRQHELIRYFDAVKLIYDPWLYLETDAILA